MLSKRVAVTAAADAVVLAANEAGGSAVIINRGPGSCVLATVAPDAAVHAQLAIGEGLRVDPKGREVVKARCAAGATAELHVLGD